MKVLSFLTNNRLETNYRCIRNVRLLIMYVGLFVLLYSCSESEVIPNNAAVINVNESEIISADQVIDSVDFLVLDTSFNALMSGIARFDIHNDIIYCLNLHNAGYIMAFDISGRFLFKIERVGRALNEWIALRRFHIDRVNNRLILVDASGKKVIITDLQGNFIESVPLKSLLVYDAIGLSTGEFVVPSTFFLVGGEKNDYTKHKIHMFDSSGEPIGNFIESTFIDNIGGYKLNELSMNNQGEVFYAPSYLNTIFTVANNGVKPCYSIVYNGSKDLVTDEYINNRISENSMWQISEADEKKYTFFNGSFIDSDRYVYIRMGDYYPIDVFYDKQINETITTRLYSQNDVRNKMCNTYVFQSPMGFYKDEWWAVISPSFFEIPQDYFEGEKSELYNEMRQIYDSHKEGCNMFVRYKLKNR